MDPAMQYEVRALGRQQAMLAATRRGDSAVQRFYAGATLLISGASGFLGKQLVEKLLRSCPDIKKIYILLREKKGVDINTRVSNILEDPVFTAVRKQHPTFQQKLVAIAGDTSQIGLGLSETDRRTIAEEVDVIIHAAATTRFDEQLYVVTNTNLRGTREMIQVAKECKKLRSFVYVSTAYSTATADLLQQEVLEQYYPPPARPAALLDLVNSLDGEVLEDIAPKLIKGWHNSYTFVKRLAEEEVRRAAGLPVCVIRPTIGQTWPKVTRPRGQTKQISLKNGSLTCNFVGFADYRFGLIRSPISGECRTRDVIGTYSEPTPGWLEPSCAYGASGTLIGTGLGIVHVLKADHDCTVDLVPADMVNNLVIVAGWETARRFEAGETEHRIYQIGSSNRNPLKFSTLKHLAESGVPRDVKTSPLAPYYIFCFSFPQTLVCYLLYWLLHFIPGYVVDGVLFLMGKKPMLTKVYTKAWKLTCVLGPFLTNHWTFRDDNTVQLYNKLSNTDRQIYNFDITSFKWEDMMATWIIGIRKYIVKDGLKDTEYGMKKQDWLKYVNYVVLSLYAFVWWKVLCLVYWLLSFVLRI